MQVEPNSCSTPVRWTHHTVDRTLDRRSPADVLYRPRRVRRAGVACCSVSLTAASFGHTGCDPGVGFHSLCPRGVSMPNTTCLSTSHEARASNRPATTGGQVSWRGRTGMPAFLAGRHFDAASPQPPTRWIRLRNPSELLASPVAVSERTHQRKTPGLRQNVQKVCSRAFQCDWNPLLYV